jgi:hypothetical protein
MRWRPEFDLGMTSLLHRGTLHTMYRLRAMLSSVVGTRFVDLIKHQRILTGQAVKWEQRAHCKQTDEYLDRRFHDEDLMKADRQSIEPGVKVSSIVHRRE